MAQQTFNGGFYFPEPLWGATYGRAAEDAFTIASANHRVAMVFQAPVTGTIDRIAFRVVGHTTPATLTVRLETVDASGNPSGSLVGSASGTQLTTGANTTHVVTLGAGGSVTRGTWYAAVVSQPAASAGSCTIQFWATGNEPDRGLGRLRQCYVLNNTGSWPSHDSNTFGQACPSMAVRYDDTNWYYILGSRPMSAYTRTAFNSGTNPNERGTRIILPFPTTVTGWFFFGNCANQDYEVILYDSTPTAQATFAGDKDIAVGYLGNNYSGLNAGYFPTPFVTTAGATYYLLLRPTSTTDVALVDFTILDTATTAMMGIFNGGTDFVLATRNGGAVSVDATKRPYSMGIICSGFDDATGGGGGGVTAHIANMNRGLA